MAILLFGVIAALASGVPQYYHELDHAHEDAIQAAGSPHYLPPLHHHSEQNCPVCAAFHAPLFSQSGALHIMIAGDWLPFVSMQSVSQHPSPLITIILCRGPPALIDVNASA